MAGAGFKTFNTGDVLTASDVNTYLMQQTTMVFADASARSTALGANVAEGMISYLKDTNAVERYDGSSWGAIGAGDIEGVTAGTGLTGGGTSGTVTLSLDQANYGGGQWAAGKNKIINGDFRINQRSFSSTTTNNTYGFDRWALSYTGGTATYSAQTFTAGTAPVTGYEGTNFARLVTASQSAAGDYAAIQQKIESVRTFANQAVTVSFWAKASTGTPKLGITLEQNFGSGGSSAVVTSPAVATISSSWTRYSFNVNVPSISGKTIGTAGDNLNLLLLTSVGTSISALGYAAVGIQNVTIDIWGVQVEAGSTATPFQTATGTIQGELAACQRYYYRSTLDVNGNYGMGIGYNTTNAFINFVLPVTMRVLPTSIDFTLLQLWDATNTIAVTSMALQSSNNSSNVVCLYVGVASGLTQYRPYILRGNGSGTYIGINAEL